MDVKFVGPHFLISDGPYDVKDGIAGFHAPAEGVAVGREPFIVVIEFEGKEFEDGHLFGGETVNHPFLARPHLVDNLFLGNAQTFSLNNPLRQRKILFPFHISVGLVELMPGETAFHESIGKKLFPSFLPGQLC